MAEPRILALYPLTNYVFGVKEAQVEKDASPEARMLRMKENFEQQGMRRTVEGVLLTHLHQHPHLLLLQNSRGEFRLPGGRVRPGHDEVDVLKRKLTSKIAPTLEGFQPLWEIGEVVGQWWRPQFEPNVYPYLPAHVTRPKECNKMLHVLLPEKCKFAVPQNMKLVAVPFYDLYDNVHTYGSMLASIPELYSRYQFAYL